MDTCSFDMFHNTRNEDICTVTYRIYFQLLTHQILIDKDRMLLCILIDDCHKFLDLRIGNRDLHALTAKYIGRSDKYRIAQSVGNLFCFFCRKDSSARSSRNTGLL